jgi:hypothetical protein
MRTLGILVSLIATASAFAASPLSELPSPPGPHIKKIKSLEDRGWLNLGSPAPDPRWGKARGRSWGCRMPFSPELRGAFLFGEGVHGYVKPDGHVMDDLWFYDLNQHRWVCCYPGAEVATLNLKVDANGFETNAGCEPIPLSQMAHAYEGITYDTDLRRFMAMPCPNHDYLIKSLKQRRAAWWQERKENNSAASPWFFESDNGKWNRRATGTASPRSGYGDSFHYLPGLHRAFFRHTDEIWFYDTNENSWSQAQPTGPPLPFGIDATSCYDTKRKRIYIGGGSYPVSPPGTNAFRIYDLETNAWIDPQPKGAPCKGSNSYATNIASMEYDSANDVVIVFRYGGATAERGIFAYSPVTNEWSEAANSFPEKWGQCTNGFYNPVLKAHFFHVASDSDDNGTIWVYRHKG